MGSIKALTLVEDLGTGMRILKGLDIQGDAKSAFWNRLAVPTIAAAYNSASCNWNDEIFPELPCFPLIYKKNSAVKYEKMNPLT